MACAGGLRSFLSKVRLDRNARLAEVAAVGVSPRKPDFTVTFSPVTPIFMGGAEPNERAEMRLASIKGLLRFWYRAVDPEYKTHEARIFGGLSKDTGQSSFLLTLRQQWMDTSEWSAETVRALKKENTFGRDTISGLGYVGFPLRVEPKGKSPVLRYSLPVSEPGGRNRTFVRVTHYWRPERRSEQAAKALVASWWLLCTLGGLGSRCRRGLGSVALDSWEGEEDLTTQLPLTSGAANLDDWEERVTKGLGVILRDWFPGSRDAKPTHSQLQDQPQLYVLKSGSAPWEWPKALEEGGRLLQAFRRKKPPDYGDVLAWLGSPAGTPLKQVPKRAAFGLPITWQYSSTSSRAEVQGGVLERDANGRERMHPLDRMASPLWLRVIRVGKGHYPVFFQLRTPFLGGGVVVVQEKLKDGKTFLDGRQAHAPHPGGAILAQFLDELARNPDVRRVVL